MRTWIRHSSTKANRRSIGVDITPYCIRALQIREQADQFYIEKAFSVPTQRHSDTPIAIIRQLTEHHGFDRRLDVAVAMPHNSVFYREVKMDSCRPDQVGQPNSSGLDNHFPIPAAQMIAHTCGENDPSGDSSSQLVAATDRDSVQQRLDHLSELQITPKLIESEIFALRAAALVNYPDMRFGRYVIVYVDQCHLSLAVLEDARVLVVRNTPMTLRTKRQDDTSREQKAAEFISHEVRMTWQKVFEDEVDSNARVLIATEHTFSSSLIAYIEQELSCPTELLDPCKHIQCATDLELGCDMVIAAGLAIRMLGPDRISGVNFLEGHHPIDHAPINLRKEVAVCSTLLLAIGIAWIVGLFVELSSLESRYSSLKADIEQTFRQVAPEEKNIVSPAVQLTQKIKTLEQEQQRFSQYLVGSSPLTVLKRISMSRPSSSTIRVNNLLVAGESASVRAICSSFDEPYQWQRALKKIPGFAQVETQSPQKDGKTGKVSFKIVLSTERPGVHDSPEQK
jgi:Tfp pilus assembly PilM family ATPase